MAFEELTQKFSKKGREFFASKKASLFKDGSRFVLFIGDEGAILVYIKDSVVKSRQFIADTQPQTLESLRESMAADPKAALLVVVDTIDQSYVQQTLPPVSALSIKKLIRRRLDRDFGANDIKGAVILGREQAGRKDWNFMMISLERTPLLSAWIDFIGTVSNRFQGFYLVAAESEMLIKGIERSLPRNLTGSDWKFFVSHNKVSGFRQVILHKGRVVFTRMAQPVGETTPEVMAGNIEQEMLSTIEYMRRLSFDPQSGLDVYIIASSGIRDVLDSAKFKPSVRHMNVLTPYEVAQALNIEGATQPADQFGDVVLAASIGRAARHVLTLHTTESQKFNQLYQLMLGLRMVGLGIGLCGALYALFIILMMYGTYLDASNQEAIKVEQEKKLALVRLAIRQSAMDVEKTNDMIDLYAQLERERFSPLALLNRVQLTLPSGVMVKGIEVNYDDGGKPGTAPAMSSINMPVAASSAGGVAARAPVNNSLITANFTMEFPGITTLEVFKPLSGKLVADLRQAFPGFDISYTRLPSIFSEDEKLDMTFGDNKTTASNQIASQSMDVVLTITGRADALEALSDQPVVADKPPTQTEPQP